jgi:UDP-N-acetylmuramoyl-L-alanyl-D-glutamate--2,6-diaminopimelate ligase
MGKLAAQLADRIIITSDNPRAENPEDILADIQQGIDQEDQSKVTTAIDRAFAILTSVKQSLPKDVVLVAGKGHERVQEIAGKQFQFSDQDHIRLAIRGVM